jgi:hypothetical protein
MFLILQVMLLDWDGQGGEMGMVLRVKLAEGWLVLLSFLTCYPP